MNLRKRKPEIENTIPFSVSKKFIYDKKERSLILSTNNLQNGLELKDVELALNIMGNNSIKKIDT